MNRMQKQVAIQIVLAELDAYGIDYVADKIATLAGLPINIINKHIYRVGWKYMGHQYAALEYWELHD